MTINSHVRECVVRAHLNKRSVGLTISEILKIFNISNGSLYNFLKDYRKHKNLPKIKIRKTYPSKFSLPIRRFIVRHVRRYKQIRYSLIYKSLNDVFRISISLSSIYRILKENNLSYKKASYIKIYKNNYKDTKKKIQTLKKQMAIKNIKNVFFIDESSINLNFVPTYGWSTVNKQCIIHVDITPIRYTLLMAINANKCYYQLCKGSVDKFKYNAFIKYIIDKHNKIILFMDNARIHHNKLLKEYIMTTSAEIIYNVPYTPALNPIERIFCTIKTHMKINKVKSLKHFVNGIINVCTLQTIRNTINSVYKLF